MTWRQKNQFTFIFLFTFLLLVSYAKGDDDPDKLVEQAWSANRSVEALNAKIEAASQKIPQAGVWKDPVLAVEYSNVPVDSFALGDHPMSGVQLKLQQTFPFPGKTTKRKRSAEAKTKVARYELSEKQNQLRGMVKRSYWNLALTRHLKKITENHIQKIDDLIASVKVKYETGSAGQHDLLRLQVQRDRLLDDLSEFDRRETALIATINAILSRYPGTAVQTPDSVDAIKPDLMPQAAFDQAIKNRPLLFAFNSEAKAEGFAAKQSAFEGWPDPTFWVGYRFRQEVVNDQGMVADKGADFFTAGLSFPIPVFYGSRWGAAKKEHQAAKRSARMKQASLSDDIQGGLQESFAAWNRAYDKSQTYAQVIAPGQKQTLDSTLAAYQVGRADFSSLFAAQVGLLDAQRVLIKAKCETRIQQSNVETLIGDGIPELGEKQ